MGSRRGPFWPALNALDRTDGREAVSKESGFVATGRATPLDRTDGQLRGPAVRKASLPAVPVRCGDDITVTSRDLTGRTAGFERDGLQKKSATEVGRGFIHLKVDSVYMK